MTRVFLYTLLLCCSASGITAHDLEIGDTLFKLYSSVETIETSYLVIEKSFFDDDHYKISIRSKSGGWDKISIIDEDGGQIPQFSAFNEGIYCKNDILFITVRYESPNAIWFDGYFPETLAFRADTFEYLDSAFGHYEDIARLEDGVDLGYPYEIPQRFHVKCKDGTRAEPFEFSFVDQRSRK